MLVRVTNAKDKDIFEGVINEPHTSSYDMVSWIHRKVNQYPFSDISITVSYTRVYETNDLFEDLPF